MYSVVFMASMYTRALESSSIYWHNQSSGEAYMSDDVEDQRVIFGREGHLPGEELLELLI